MPGYRKDSYKRFLVLNQIMYFFHEAQRGIMRFFRTDYFLKVQVQDSSGTELAAREEISNITPPDRTFAQSAQDLSAYTAQSIQLVFHVITDAQDDRDFFVDDVSARACGPK